MPGGQTEPCEDRRAGCNELVVNVREAVASRVRSLLPRGYDDPEAVAQETLLALFQWCLKGGNAKSATAYAAGIARIKALDFLRRQHRQKHISLETDEVPQPDPESLSRAAQMNALHRAIGRLPPELRGVIEGRRLGLTREETASRLNISPATVGRRLQEARERLQAALKEE